MRKGAQRHSGGRYLPLFVAGGFRAIEGALRQRQVARLERVAVDTHGFTHFAMALAKLVGFDLCPRLAGLKKRRLYLPKGLEVPQVLQPIVAETVSRRAIGRGWEGLLRLGASVKHGWDSATAALDRFGSAAAGDPVYNAGDALGRLLRTLYLCDYLSNPVFRMEVLDLLNQGEAVHSLQRAIHNGMITAKQGRTTEELGTISGALTLLANIVMAWNTHHLQAMIDRAPERSSRRGDEPACADRSQAHQHARHPDVRSCPLQIKPASPSALGRRRPPC